MRVQQIIDEIAHLENRPGHKSAYEIHRLLSANRSLFLKYLEKADLDALIGKFEAIAEQKTGYYSTEWYSREFGSALSLLRFYLSRIL